MSDTPTPVLPPGIDRRGFLRHVAGGTAAVVIASSIPERLAAAFPRAEQDGVHLYALSPEQYATALAAGEVLLEDVPVPPSQVAQRIDREIALAGDPVRTDVRTVLTVLQHGTLFGGHAFRRFTQLSAAERLRYLRGWGTSRFTLRRAVYQATRSFVYFYAYADDATRPLTGFEGPWPERFQIPVTSVDFGEIA